MSNPESSDAPNRSPRASAGPASPPEKAPTGQTIAGSVFSLGSGKILSRLIAFFGTAYLARVLGPDGFGVVGFAVALSGYLSLAIKAGISGVGAREVAQAPDRATDLAASLILARLIMALGAFAVLGLIAWFLPKPDTVRFVVFLTGLSYFALALDTAWVHKGLEQNRLVAIAAILNEAVYVVLLFLAVNEPADVSRVPVALFVGQLAASLLLATFVFYNASFTPNLHVGFSLFKKSRHLIVTKVLRTLLVSFDVVLLGFMIGERDVGLYTAAYRVCHMLSALSGSILFAYLPEFARAVSRGRQRTAEVATRSLEFSWAVGAPLVIGGIVVAAPLLRLLFGDEYTAASLAFQLLLVASGFIFVRGTLHNVFLSLDRLKTEMWIMASAVVLNVGLNLVLIPRYSLVGAAAATALAEGLNVALGIVAVHRMNVRPQWSRLLNPLGAALLMGVILLLATPPSPWIQVPVGGLIYVAALFLLQGVPTDVIPHLEEGQDRIRDFLSP